MAAGIAVVGATVIAANPLAINVASDVEQRVEHRAVQLTSGVGEVIADYEDVIAQTGANLQTLGAESGAAFSALFNQVAANQAVTNGLIDTAVTGTKAALHQSLYGGWYGSDDGYVFGLFEGSLTHDGVTKTGSTLAEIGNALAHGDLYGAYSYYDTWSLEALQHVTKPLLSPILSTAKTGATPTPTIEVRFLQNLTNVVASFANYHSLQNIFDGVLSPQIGVTYGALADIDKIGGALSTGHFGQAGTDLLEMPADLTNDVLNGYINPNIVTNPTGKPFVGLLNDGSLLQQLLVTWPEQLAKALGQQSASTSAQALSLGGGLSQATSSLLPNLAKAAQPAALLGNLGNLGAHLGANLGAAIGPLLANLAAQLSGSLAPNLISGLLLHLPALILSLL
jgi:hypothetical protein